MKRALIKSEKKHKSNGCFENVQGRALKSRSREDGRKKTVTGAKPNIFCHSCCLVMKAMF
jgi:hypothetical protein